MEQKSNQTAQHRSCWAFLRNSPKFNRDLFAHLIFWSATAIGLAVDLWTKAAVFKWLQSKPIPHVTILNGFIDLVTSVNDGAAFGLGSGQRGFLVTVSALAMLVVLLIFLFGTGNSRIICFALGLFQAGICGNLFDRIFNNGFVRDFIDLHYRGVYHWPAFNVADSLLCIAVAIIFLHTFIHRPCQKHVQQQK